jgi:uncharacterized integral membrane protein
MVRLIFSVVMLVLIAVLIVLNAGTIVSFNLFGWTFPEVPVIVVAIAGFTVGVLYSFLFYLLRSVAKIRRARMEERHDRLRERAEKAEAAVQQGGTPGDSGEGG